MSKEKALKNHAAEAFRDIWLKRRAVNLMIAFTQLSKDAKAHKAQRFIAFMKVKARIVL